MNEIEQRLRAHFQETQNREFVVAPRLINRTGARLAIVGVIVLGVVGVTYQIANRSRPGGWIETANSWFETDSQQTTGQDGPVSDAMQTKTYLAQAILISGQPHGVLGNPLVMRESEGQIIISIAGCEFPPLAIQPDSDLHAVDSEVVPCESTTDPVATAAIAQGIIEGFTIQEIETDNFKIDSSGVSAVLSRPPSAPHLLIDTDGPIDAEQFGDIEKAQPIDFEQPIDLDVAISWAQASGFSTIVWDSAIADGDQMVLLMLDPGRIKLNDLSGVVTGAVVG